MIKHNRLAWSALNYNGLTQNQSAKETKRIIVRNNPHSKEMLSKFGVDYIRKKVSMRLGWTRTPVVQTYSTGVKNYSQKVTIEFRGTKIIVPAGETVKLG